MYTRNNQDADIYVYVNAHITSMLLRVYSDTTCISIYMYMYIIYMKYSVYIHFTCIYSDITCISQEYTRIGWL